MIKKSVSAEFSEFQGEVSLCTGTLAGERYCLGDIRQVSLYDSIDSTFLFSTGGIHTYDEFCFIDS